MTGKPASTAAESATGSAGEARLPAPTTAELRAFNLGTSVRVETDGGVTVVTCPCTWRQRFRWGSPFMELVQAVTGHVVEAHSGNA